MSKPGKKPKAVILLCGLFVAAMVLGIALDRYLLSAWFDEPTHTRSHRRRHHRSKSRDKKLDRLIRRFKRKLGLDARQEKVVRQALEESWRETNEVRLRIEPRLRQIRQSHRQKILEVLNPKQRERYERMVRRYEEKRALRLR
jgi:hypothetical protein